MELASASVIGPTHFVGGLVEAVWEDDAGGEQDLSIQYQDGGDTGE